MLKGPSKIDKAGQDNVTMLIIIEGVDGQEKGVILFSLPLH